MRRTLVGMCALALTAMSAGAADMTMPTKAPAPEATPQATGYVELYGGGARTKEELTLCAIGDGCISYGNTYDGWVLGGAGRGNYWWAPNASVQLDAQGEGTSYRYPTGSSGHFSTHSYLIGAHASWRDSQRGLIGVFGGAGDTTAISSSSIRHGLIGLEGQAYWRGLTLYGQVGYDSTLGDVTSSLDRIHAWFARGTVRLYANPNLRFEGTVLYADGAYDFNATGVTVPTFDFNTWLWRAKAEHKFATAPFSIFAAYEGSRTNYDIASGVLSENVRITDHRFLGGIRLYLGENTLQWNDNRGATLDIIAPLSVPSFMFGGGGLD